MPLRTGFRRAQSPAHLVETQTRLVDRHRSKPGPRQCLAHWSVGSALHRVAAKSRRQCSLGREHQQPRRGDALGINTPFCDGIVDVVKRVERGELKSEEANLEPLKAML